MQTPYDGTIEEIKKMMEPLQTFMKLLEEFRDKWIEQNVGATKVQASKENPDDQIEQEYEPLTKADLYNAVRDVQNASGHAEVSLDGIRLDLAATGKIDPTTSRRKLAQMLRRVNGIKRVAPNVYKTTGRKPKND